MKRRNAPTSTRKLKRPKSKEIEPPEIEPEVDIDADLESFHTPTTGPELEQIQATPPTTPDEEAFLEPLEEPPESPRDSPREAPIEVLTEEEMFVRTFHDYPAFMGFINNELCRQPVATDYFCACISQLLTPQFFSRDAPPGYSLYTAEVERSETPFFDSMKIIFARMPHLNPSIVPRNGIIEPPRTSFFDDLRQAFSSTPNYDPIIAPINGTTEHHYMIVLDRLIYYYQIYTLMTERQLRGFSNTAGFVIYMHGSYPIYDASNKKSIKNVNLKIENVFLCTRAAPGCLAMGYDTAMREDFKNPDSALWTMTNNISTKRYVNFDEVVFKIKGRADDLTMAVCYKLDSKRGRAMEHYIHPNRKKYINKTYTAKYGDYLSYVIDLEKLEQVRHYKHMTLDQKIKYCDIMQNPFIMSRRVNTPKIFRIELSDIVDYATEFLDKQNVFIYDRSCSVIEPVTTWVNGKAVLPPIEEIVPFVEGYTREGFGRRRRKRQKKRITIKHPKRIGRKTKRRVKH